MVLRKPLMCPLAKTKKKFTFCTLAYKIINKYKVTLMRAWFFGGWGGAEWG
jgi:hypothetical protein